MPLIIFIFGLIIGSFLNVVILRYNTGRSLGGRSACFSCGVKLRWAELLPVISFLGLRGRCRSCRSPISWQYPLVELATGCLFTLLYLAVPLGSWWLLGLLFVASACLVVITVYDFYHQIIPDLFVFTLIVTGLVYPLILPGSFVINLLWSLWGGFFMALPLFLLWLVSSGRWMGFGDIKLALGLGFFLGLSGGLSALLLAFFLGAGVGVLLIAWSKRRHKRAYTLKSEIPFAPFLILAFWLEFFLHLNIINVFFF